jgi:hypothetical protein
MILKFTDQEEEARKTKQNKNKTVPKKENWMQVAHACNPSYSGGRYQEDRGSKPAWAK